MVSLITFCIITFYFAVTAIAAPIVALSAEACSDTSDAASEPIPPPKNEPTLQPKLLLSDAVLLSPDAISLNAQQHSR